METVLFSIAIGAIVSAFGIGIANKMKRSQQIKEPGPFCFTPMETPTVPVAAPLPSPCVGKHQRNKRGWRAPPGHYFNDRGELVSNVGDLIVDMIIIAKLCGEQYSEPVEEIAYDRTKDGFYSPVAESAAACSEASASASCCSESSSEVAIQSDSSSPSPSGDGGYDSGGCDSGE